jgi:NAD(P)H-hydrate epimerase
LSAEVKNSEQQWALNQAQDTWPLMLKAAKSFVRQFLERFKSRDVVVIAGSGNNGGDGYCIGKLLIEAGISVVVFAPLGNPPKKIDAHRARQEYLSSGGAVVTQMPHSADVAIDALFGIGLSRALSDETALLIENINSRFTDIYSVDIPSGLNADTGVPYPIAISALATHCFIAFKPGLLTCDGPSLVGELTLDALGVETSSYWQRSADEPELPNRIGNTHKAKHGNLRVVGSENTMVGASVIAARAGLNAGAGRVFLHGNPQSLASVYAMTPEIMVSDQFDSSDDHSVVVIGPGLGRDERANGLMQMMLSSGKRGGVLDADALRYLARNQTSDVRHWVLTPHENEAAELLDCSSADVRNNRPNAALQLAQKYQCVVVLKGAGSIVAYGHQLWFCHVGHPAMATPGMGDCLAGIIGSLIAQGQEPLRAAINGVNWHARLGLSIADKQRIVLASDIIDRLKLTLN